MKTRFIALAAVSLCVAAIPLPALGQTPLGTAFTYQGKLEQAGVPLDGTADLEFRLFGAASGGAQIGSTQTVSNVTIADGLFTASLNFGATAFNGDARWLEIAVRSPAGSGAFTTLTPRQPLTATPYALKVPGIDGHSLDAVDASPTDVVFVNAAGNVGIGTTTPGKKLTVAGEMEIGTSASDYRHMRIGGGNCSGFLYGSYPALGDGIHMGYNYYADAAGAHRIIASDGQTSRVSTGYGYIALATGGINQVPVNRIFVNTSGNIGLGTDSPATKLDVRGDVKLGPSGQYFAPAGEERLRMVRGNIDGNGTILQGSGFTAVRLGEGWYRITFTPSFAGTPSVTATAHRPPAANQRWCWVEEGQLNSGSVVIQVMQELSTTDSDFSFCAIGPR